MKRLTLLLLGLVVGVTATANAQGLTMQMSNGWSFSFSGNVNVFWVFSADSSKPGKNSSVRTGLLPAFATFEARGKEAGMNLAVHFGFAPQIQNAGRHDQFGAQIDMRQVYLTFSGEWGTILAGRELALFQRQNILNDMTLFGVGAVGSPQGGGTTLGRIGYGYIYPNFNAQVTYTSTPKNPVQVSVGLFQPSVIGDVVSGNTGFTVTKIPRVEAEATWHRTEGANKYFVWVGGEWQTTSNAADSSVSSVGGTAGVKVEVQDLAVVVSGYIGSGIGTTFGFSYDALSQPNRTYKRKSDGGYVQATYTFNKKTTAGFSWGFSRLKGAGAASADGSDSPLGQVTLYTVGIYHQWTKSLKLVFEGSREINKRIGTAESVLPAVIGTNLDRTDLSAGFMLFY